MGADEVMSACSPAPCCLPRAAPYLPDPVESRDPRSATSGAGQCEWRRHFVRPSRAMPARFDLRLGLLQAGCVDAYRMPITPNPGSCGTLPCRGPARAVRGRAGSLAANRSPGASECAPELLRVEVQHFGVDVELGDGRERCWRS